MLWGRFGHRSRVAVGDPVDVAVTAENLHFSDAQTRQAIYD
jgi:hypothetical protein